VVDGVGDDLVDQRRRDPAVRSGRRPRLGQEPRFPVGEVALPELVVPAAGDPEVAAGLHHAQTSFRHQVQHPLAQACQTRRRSHGRLLPVELSLNGRSISLAPLLVWEVREMSGFNVGTTA